MHWGYFRANPKEKQPLAIWALRYGILARHTDRWVVARFILYKGYQQKQKGAATNSLGAPRASSSNLVGRGWGMELGEEQPEKAATGGALGRNYEGEPRSKHAPHPPNTNGRCNWRQHLKFVEGIFVPSDKSHVLLSHYKQIPLTTNLSHFLTDKIKFHFFFFHFD